MACKATAISNLRPLVICGPSGSGKSSLLVKLMCEYPSKFGFCASHTTRNRREGEINGIHYRFTNVHDMQKAISEGKFIETAEYGGNLYGTSKEEVAKITNRGMMCILDVEVNGVRQIKKSDLNPWYIFIQPPSIEELERRLRSRRTETEESLKERLRIAKNEIEYGLEPGNFDKIIVNDEFDSAYEELKAFVDENILEKETE
ncbi:hypothetical protein WA026_014287 [Henosepilachna vigintioctopunctata]|uniref:guanylate kinase n=1 Tax=Henosepilachna vigintioctopunctata TaxID=420089 RepID=A0AAW1TVT2_9CUCU